MTQKERIRSHLFLLAEDEVKRSTAFGSVSALGGIAIAALKAILGVYSSSAFLAMNAFFSVCAAISKLVIVKASHDSEQSMWKSPCISQHACFVASGIVLMIGSLAYAAYGIAIILFEYGTSVDYDKIVGISIATIAFFELGASIFGIIRFKRARSVIVHALKRINLTIGVVMLSLAQVAILSFTVAAQDIAANGFMAALCGIASAMIGASIIKLD